MIEDTNCGGTGLVPSPDGEKVCQLCTGTGVLKTEPVTEEVTEPVTEEVTEEVTEPVTEEVTEPVTEEVTEPVTEEVTEE